MVKFQTEKVIKKAETLRLMLLYSFALRFPIAVFQDTFTAV